jgi:hypothetical protein
MTHHSKEKRTKEEILRLLDRALAQEENQAQKIRDLEAKLLDCQQKAENPRGELDTGALPASKIAFRIDYYQTVHDNTLKGIVEHLQSRATMSFHGEGIEAITRFMSGYLVKNSAKSGKKSANSPVQEISPAVQPEPAALTQTIEPELVAEAPPPTPVKQKTPQQENFSLHLIDSVQNPGNGSPSIQVVLPDGLLAQLPKDGSRFRIDLTRLEGNEVAIFDGRIPAAEGVFMLPEKPIAVPQKGAYRIGLTIWQRKTDARFFYRDSRLLVVASR